MFLQPRHPYCPWESRTAALTGQATYIGIFISGPGFHSCDCLLRIKQQEISDRKFTSNQLRDVFKCVERFARIIIPEQAYELGQKSHLKLLNPPPFSNKAFRHFTQLLCCFWKLRVQLAF